ncbi:hypothetical protein CJ030_MR1G023376 [Morella rubra]|uniref:Uncharacterized protein n=1 Tax=Morella rubra TaxID=262757 RepID=A0A6A1WMP7_9ROSI|nr:hypothetical protein CJ030_MR1G023376 [Morella rubra]
MPSKGWQLGSGVVLQIHPLEGKFIRDRMMEFLGHQSELFPVIDVVFCHIVGNDDENIEGEGFNGLCCYVADPPKLTNFGIFALVTKGFLQLLLIQILIRGGMTVISSYLVLDRSISLARTVEAHVDAILGVGSIDWNALVCRENESWLGHTMSELSPRMNPSPRPEKISHERHQREDLRKESSRLPSGSTSTKQRYSREAEGPFHWSSSKKRRTSPPMASEAKEEEAEEAPLAHTSSKRGASSGSKDIPHVFSPNSGVCTEISVPAVKEIHEIGTPTFSVSLAALSVRGEPPSSIGISDPIVTSTSDLLEVATQNRLEVDERDRLAALFDS